ncbi:septum formation initiator family protein [Streptomyces sp. NPDC059740]|uniref:FtsB family cell division protein n=1 Tax=Streptomyces sp. NPDC059740 TaxID=3346926 RepID=UPI003667516C
MPADRFPTAIRLRALGEQAAARMGRDRRPARRTRLTGRAALLALVLCSLVVALAYPTRQYIAQRAQIAEQRQAARQAAAERDRLRTERTRWKDDAYVRRQARERLHYVLPGETGYTVVDGGSGASPAPSPKPSQSPWYDTFWHGVDSADR